MSQLLNNQSLIDRLLVQADRIRVFVDGVGDEQMRWRPSPADWSILEVINHLYDEEREDFRVRLDYILHRPDESWPRIDPQGWVTSRSYNEREPAESVSHFLNERQRSLVWLAELPPIDPEQTAPAPWGEEIRAGDMAAAWVAHDLLHTRQLVELHWAWTQRAVAPYDSRYAGDW